MDDRYLDDWFDASEEEVTSSADPRVQRLIDACRTGSVLEITYLGGSTPGASRRIHPRKVFRKRGYGATYVRAYCEKRREERTFRVGRILFPGETRIPRSTGITRHRTGSATFSRPSPSPRHSAPTWSPPVTRPPRPTASPPRQSAPSNTGCAVVLALALVSVTAFVFLLLP